MVTVKRRWIAWLGPVAYCDWTRQLEHPWAALHAQGGSDATP